MASTRKWPRRKIASKRSWLARYHLGKLIPYTAIVDHPDLMSRLERAPGQIRYQINCDALRQRIVGEA